MAQQKSVYKNPRAGQPLISTISTVCKTPVLEVKFCNLVKPYYYSNSPTIPRYSITCVFDPELHKEFLTGVQTIEKNEKVDSVIKNETIKEEDEHVNTGKVLIKFQSKDMIPVFTAKKTMENGKVVLHSQQLIELEDELAKGENVVVIYDILRYTKKNTMKTEHGISFRPSGIFLISKEGADGES